MLRRECSQENPSPPQAQLLAAGSQLTLIKAFSDSSVCRRSTRELMAKEPNRKSLQLECLAGVGAQGPLKSLVCGRLSGQN